MPPSNQNMDDSNPLDDGIHSGAADSDLNGGELMQGMNVDQLPLPEPKLGLSLQNKGLLASGDIANPDITTESQAGEDAKSDIETLNPVDTSVIDSVTLSDIVDDVGVGVGEIIADQKDVESSQKTKREDSVNMPEGSDELNPTNNPEVQHTVNSDHDNAADTEGNEENAHPEQNIEITNENEPGQAKDNTISPEEHPCELSVEIINPSETVVGAVDTPEQNAPKPSESGDQELDIINTGETGNAEIQPETEEPENVIQASGQEIVENPPKTPEEKQQAAKDWIEKHIVITEGRDTIIDPKHKLVLADHEEIPEEYSSEIVLLLLSTDEDSPGKKLGGIFPGEEFIKSNINKFNSLDDRAASSIIENFISGGTVSWLLDNIKCFPGIKPDEELANRLVDSGWGSEIVEHVGRFEGVKLDAEFANRLIEEGQAYVVIEHIKDFDGVIPDGTFMDRLINLGEVDLVIDNPDVFKGVVIDEAFINRSIEKNPENVVRIVEAKSTPQALLSDELAKLIIETKGASELFFVLEKFSPNLSNEVASQIIQAEDSGMAGVVFVNIGKFPKLDAPKVLEIIDATGLKPKDYAKYIKWLPESMHSEIILNRTQQEGISSDDIRELIEGATWLNNDVMRVIETRLGIGYVFQHRDKFSGITLDMELANKLQAIGRLSADIDVFPPSMHEDLVRLVCEKAPGSINDINDKMEKLQISQELSEKVHKLYNLRRELERGSREDLEDKFGKYFEALAQYFPDYDSNGLVLSLERYYPKTGGAYNYAFTRSIFQKFSDLSLDTADKLINSGYVGAVLDFAESFMGLQLNDSFAQQIITSGHVDVMTGYLQKFSGLSPETAGLIIDQGYDGIVGVANNPDSFAGTEQDPMVIKAQFIVEKLNQVNPSMLSEVVSYIDTTKELAVLKVEVPRIVEVLLKIQNSASSEMANFASPIMRMVLASDSPQEALDDIEQIFVRNNIPTPIKLLEVYKILNPEISDLVTEHQAISPVLKHEVKEGRSPFDTFAADLIRASIGSNNRSLRQFLQTIKDGEGLMSVMDDPSFDPSHLSEEDQKRIILFLDRLDTVADVTDRNSGQSTSEMSLQERYWQLKHELGADDETLANRITRLFAYPVGMSSVDQLLEEMDQIAYLADKRGRQLASSGEFTLSKGDLVKGVVESGTIGFLGTILQNGSVAKEFLGDSSSSDATPLDTDLSMILEQRGSLGGTLLKTEAYGYGGLYFVLKDRDSRFLVTRDETGDRRLTEAEDYTKLELFKTSVAGVGHYGIRTGFASSEIDFMMVRSSMDPSAIQRAEWEIAKSGFYIPIVSVETGELIFSPEEFDSLRGQLSGLPEYGLRTYDFSPSLDDLITVQDVDEVIRSVKQTETTGQAVKSTIGTILGSKGVVISDNPESHEAGAVLIDTGSTGRNTNIPGTGDFDIMVRLSPGIFNDAVKLSELTRILGEELTGESGTLVVTDSGDFRIKGIKISGIAEPVDIDISFVRQTTKLEYTSEQSLVERLSVIREQDEEKYYQVLANIAMAKRLLKGAEAYKKAYSPEAEGGLGGIGVESWVLHHGGSLLEAAQSFLEKARGKTLEQFREVYTVFDSGQNYYSTRSGRYQYDNFVDNMSTSGFDRMRDLCEQIVSGNIPT